MDEGRATAGLPGVDEEGEYRPAAPGRSRWSKLCWWPALALTHSIAHSILGREAIADDLGSSTSPWKGASPRNGELDRPAERERERIEFSLAFSTCLKIYHLYSYAFDFSTCFLNLS